MDIQRINQHTSAFNDITHYIESDNGKEKVEVWFYNRENEMCIFSKRNVHFLCFFRGFPARS